MSGGRSAECERTDSVLEVDLLAQGGEIGVGNGFWLRTILVECFRFSFIDAFVGLRSILEGAGEGLLKLFVLGRGEFVLLALLRLLLARIVALAGRARLCRERESRAVLSAHRIIRPFAFPVRRERIEGRRDRGGKLG